MAFRPGGGHVAHWGQGEGPGAATQRTASVAGGQGPHRGTQGPAEQPRDGETGGNIHKRTRHTSCHRKDYGSNLSIASPPLLSQCEM